MNLERIKEIFQSRSAFEQFVVRIAFNAKSEEQWKLRFQTLQLLADKENREYFTEIDIRKAEFQTQASIFDSTFDQDLGKVYAVITEKLDSPSAPEHKVKYLKEKILEIEEIKSQLKKLLTEEYHASLDFDFTHLKDLLPVARLMYEGVDPTSPPRLVSEVPGDIIKFAEGIIKNIKHIQKPALEIMKRSKEEDFYIQTLQSCLLKIQNLKMSLVSPHIPLLVEMGYGLERKDDDIIMIDPVKKGKSKDDFELLMSEMKTLSSRVDSIKTYSETEEPARGQIRDYKKEKEIARNHLSFLSGVNRAKGKIMGQTDYGRLLELVFELLAHGKVPKIQKQLNPKGISGEALRFAFYSIHFEIFGKKSPKRKVFIDFLHQAFKAFKKVDKGTTSAKFAFKPKNYPF